MINLKFNSNKFDKEQKEEIINFLDMQFNQLSKYLDFSRLEQIIVSDKFTEDVLEIQKKYNMNERGHTNNDNGIAPAKLLHTGIEDELHQTIVFNSIIFDNADWLLYIYHELCHVHDQNCLHLKLTKEGKSGINLTYLQHTLNCIAFVIWEEYFAYRRSSELIDFNDINVNGLDFNLLLEIINKYERNIVELIKNNQFNFLSYVNDDDMKIIFYLTAKVLGYIDGFKLQNNEVVNSCIMQIQKTFFDKTFILQQEELRRLYEIHPNWNDVYELSKLSNTIKIYWEALGLKPEEL